MCTPTHIPCCTFSLPFGSLSFIGNPTLSSTELFFSLPLGSNAFLLGAPFSPQPLLLGTFLGCDTRLLGTFRLVVLLPLGHFGLPPPLQNVHAR